MKTSSITLDRVLHRILMEEGVDCFTIMELRDRYLKFVEPHGCSLPDIRVYLYDQIRKMINHGWASYHSERKTRGQRFVIQQKPESLVVKLHSPGKGMKECTEVEMEDLLIMQNNAVYDSYAERSESTSNTACRLQQMLKETRLDLLTSYGEAERYSQMIQDIPGLKSTLEPELIASRDNSSRLLGHVNALETALQKIGEM